MSAMPAFKKLMVALPILLSAVLAGLLACNNTELNDDATDVELNVSIESHVDVVTEQDVDASYPWGSLNPPINSDYIYVTNGDLSMGNHLIREGDEFLGFTLEKIIESVIETWDGQPGMNEPVHAILSNGELIAAGDFVITLQSENNESFGDSFIFSAHEQYFKLFPAVVGDMTSGDISFIIDNTTDIMDFFTIKKPHEGDMRIEICNVTVKITAISLLGRRRDDVSHRAIVTILDAIQNYCSTD